MPQTNKEILQQGNAAVASGDYEGFLGLCTEDTRWEFVGDTLLEGKQAVREWMRENYIVPPVVTVDHLIADGEMLTAVGNVTMNEKGIDVKYNYADVWQFRDRKMAALRAFVIKAG